MRRQLDSGTYSYSTFYSTYSTSLLKGDIDLYLYQRFWLSQDYM